jgi:hypothetical protein
MEKARNISVMLDYTLSAEKLAELRAADRRTRDKREADWINSVNHLELLLFFIPSDEATS